MQERPRDTLMGWPEAHHVYSVSLSAGEGHWLPQTRSGRTLEVQEEGKAAQARGADRVGVINKQTGPQAGPAAPPPWRPGAAELSVC